MISTTKMVDIDIWHGTSAAPFFLLTSITVAGFALLTMQVAESRETDDTMHVPGYAEFVLDNRDLASSPSFQLWNPSFYFILLSFHATVGAVVCTPCTPEHLLLAPLGMSVCLMLSSAPKGSWRIGSSQTILLCFGLAVMLVASRIPYDPWGYR